MSDVPFCAVCGRFDKPLEWCGLCSKWICRDCKYKPAARGFAALKEGIRKVLGKAG